MQREASERRAAAERKRFETYRVVLCDVEVEYSVDDETKVCVMLGGVAVPPLGRPGETNRDAIQGAAVVGDTFTSLIAADTVD